MRAIKNITPVVQVSAGSAQDIRSQIATVMGRYPTLSAYGFHFSASGEYWQSIERYKEGRAQMLTDGFIDQVETCMEALATKPAWGKGWKVRHRSSYVLKHMVERWVRESERDDVARYIPNGALIVAAVLDGWVPVQWPHSPNCGFRREVAR